MSGIIIRAMGTDEDGLEDIEVILGPYKNIRVDGKEFFGVKCSGVEEEITYAHRGNWTGRLEEEACAEISKFTIELAP